MPRRVAVLGGGQLGRMLALAGLPLGIELRVLEKGGAPAAGCAVHIEGKLESAVDDAVRADLLKGVEAATFEVEHVPLAAAAAVAAEIPLRPSLEALEVAGDRLFEKQHLRKFGLQVAEFAELGDESAVEAAIATTGLPGFVKVRRQGYDGRGQRFVESADEMREAVRELGGGCIVERPVDFSREVSLVCARATTGEEAFYPLVENTHVDGILVETRAPAPDVSPELQAEAEAAAHAIFAGLDYVGVLTIEFFQTAAGLVVNEIAPRVHNSGHWTIEGAATSQFEQHLRAIVGLPLGATTARGEVSMRNCLGSMPEAAAVLAIPDAHLHDYDKAARPGRKVGHVTLVAPDVATLAERRQALVAAFDD